MEHRELEGMPLDNLWQLHEKVVEVLNARIEQEKRHLEQRIELLKQRLSADRRKPSAKGRRPYPKVLPKYRNPNDPASTWSGRGRPPHWVSELLANGTRLEEIRISN